jgi:prevent-host-death family protein
MSYHCRMSIVTLRDLQRNPAGVLRELEENRRPAFVTRRGRPVAVLMPVDEDELYDFVLAKAPEYVAGMRAADEDVARGDLGRPLEEVLAELDEDV